MGLAAPRDTVGRRHQCDQVPWPQVFTRWAVFTIPGSSPLSRSKIWKIGGGSAKREAGAASVPWGPPCRCSLGGGSFRTPGRPRKSRGLTCAQQGPAAPVPAGPAAGLGELVGRHLVEDAPDAAVAFAPPPRGAGLGSPTHGGTQGVQRQGPAETGRTVSSALGWSEDLCPPPSAGPGDGTLNPTSEAGAPWSGESPQCQH